MIKRISLSVPVLCALMCPASAADAASMKEIAKCSGITSGAYEIMLAQAETGPDEDAIIAETTKKNRPYGLLLSALRKEKADLHAKLANNSPSAELTATEERERRRIQNMAAVADTDAKIQSMLDDVFVQVGPCLGLQKL